MSEDAAPPEMSGALQPASGVFEDAVKNLRGSLTCPICLKLLYEPFTTSCGHTYCYECLNHWFAGNGDHLKKTCPACRHRIQHQPAPAFLVRQMVEVLCRQNATLPDGETVEEHVRMRGEMVSLVDKHRAATGRHGGLFEGRFSRPDRANAIHDAADGVYRCPGCHFELEDLYCSSCDLAFDEDGNPVAGDADAMDSFNDSDYTGDGQDTATAIARTPPRYRPGATIPARSAWRSRLFTGLGPPHLDSGPRDMFDSLQDMLRSRARAQEHPRAITGATEFSDDDDYDEEEDEDDDESDISGLISEGEGEMDSDNSEDNDDSDGEITIHNRSPTPTMATNDYSSFYNDVTPDGSIASTLAPVNGTAGSLDAYGSRFSSVEPESELEYQADGQGEDNVTSEDPVIPLSDDRLNDSDSTLARSRSFLGDDCDFGETDHETERYNMAGMGPYSDEDEYSMPAQANNIRKRARAVIISDDEEEDEDDVVSRPSKQRRTAAIKIEDDEDDQPIGYDDDSDEDSHRSDRNVTLQSSVNGSPTRDASSAPLRFDVEDSLNGGGLHSYSDSESDSDSDDDEDEDHDDNDDDGDGNSDSDSASDEEPHQRPPACRRNFTRPTNARNRVVPSIVQQKSETERQSSNAGRASRRLASRA